jgi:hypothetical protein
MLVKDERERASAIQARLRDQLAAINANHDLTPRARDRLKAQAVLSAREQMAALREASNNRHTREQRNAYYRAFGIDPTRSAEDRAYRDQLAANPPSAKAAAEMMAQAQQRGDTLAQRALAEMAWNNRRDPTQYWVGVLNLYGDSGGQQALSIVDLAIYDDPSKQERLRDKLYTEIMKPSDLPGDLKTLASDDGTEAG